MEYFLDKAQPYELDLYMRKYYNHYRLSWEQTRSIMYIIA